MLLSKRQKTILHAAAGQAGLSEDQRRMVQRRVGGFHSCCDSSVTHRGFVAVMAFLEERCGGRVRGFTAGYWAESDRKESPTTSLLFSIRRLGGELGYTEEHLSAFLASEKMSHGHCLSLATAPTWWLSRMLSALKAIQARRLTAQQQPAPAVEECEVPF